MNPEPVISGTGNRVASELVGQDVGGREMRMQFARQTRREPQPGLAGLGRIKTDKDIL